MSTNNREISTRSYRNTKDVQKDALATPMSVEPTTPMSVDKSTVDVGLAEKTPIRNDRDRFFDAVEYQKDILSYLKTIEVSWTALILVNSDAYLYLLNRSKRTCVLVLST